VNGVRATIAAGLMALLAPAWSAAASAQTAAPLRLVRCAPGVDVPCLVTRVDLLRRDAALVGQLDSASESRAWTGDLGGKQLIGPGVTVPRRIDPPMRLLILLDRSGSMIGEGIAFTRLTLKSFIEGLDSTSVRVAVAGFESRNVIAGIDAARFVAPREAVRVLASLAAPDPAANTALYSALVEGSRQVSAAVAVAPGTQGAVLLVTDGVNDVGHARDDPGLLAGPGGLDHAAQALAASGHRIWILGVGRGLAAEELRTLAGVNGSTALAALDPNAMAERLSSISRELRASRELTFGVRGGDAAALARAPWSGTAAAWRDGHPLLVHALAWRPPLFALPAYEGVAPAGSLTPALQEAAVAGGTGGAAHALIALVLTLMGAVLGLVVPRYAWARRAVPVGLAGIAPVRAVRASAAASAPADTGIRRDVQEAPPRKPSDVTGEFPALAR
jgi:hypothetical protein